MEFHSPYPQKPGKVLVIPFLMKSMEKALPEWLASVLRRSVDAISAKGWRLPWHLPHDGILNWLLASSRWPNVVWQKQIERWITQFGFWFLKGQMRSPGSMFLWLVWGRTLWQEMWRKNIFLGERKQRKESYRKESRVRYIPVLLRVSTSWKSSHPHSQRVTPSVKWESSGSNCPHSECLNPSKLTMMTKPLWGHGQGAGLQRYSIQCHGERW